jgi:hypothetical protein
MTPAPRLQYTSVRTRAEDGQPLIGIKHTAKNADGETIKHDWIEMPPEDVKRLIQSLQATLEELERG